MFKNIKYLKLRAGVRYWEDSELNGEDDVDLMSDTALKPKMPFAVLTGKETCIAPKGEYNWIITIELSNGKIEDWPVGNTANILYKTCDDNTFTFLDENKEVVCEYDGYVPSFLCIGDEGFGDYISFKISDDGHIEKFKFNEDDFNDVVENSF